MKLYHVTKPVHRDAILRHGFKDSFSVARGVWFSDELWAGGGTVPLADATVIGLDRVIFCIDITDETAGEYECSYENLDDDDPDYDPELDDEPPLHCYREWCIPAEIANVHFIGQVTAEQLEAESKTL